VDAKLQPGNIAEHVEVSGTTTLLETDRADTGRKMETVLLADSPLGVNRNFQTLLNLVPGTTPAAFQHSQFFNASSSLQTEVNGQLRMGNNYQIEGIDDNERTGLLQILIPPIEAIQTRSHTINMPPELLTAGDHFALEVRGDSMIEAGILDGDIALLKRMEAADTGDIVVALIDDDEATLKRFRRRGASIALEPANTAYEVRILPPNRVRIQGKLVGLFRRY